MTLVPIDILPGIFSDASPRECLKRWRAGNNVRSFKGYQEKLAGWVKQINDTTFLGICRGLTSWSSIDQSRYVGLGTHLKLYVSDGGAYFDITPIREAGTLGVDPFAVTNLSAEVVVTDTAHGLALGDYVHFAGATAGGGITVNGEYAVTEVIDANSYKIVHSVAATSTDATTGGAAVTYQYEIPVGQEDSFVGTGYGAGPYSGGTYGTPRTMGTVTQARTWSLVPWGEDLIANPKGGAIYVWDQDSGTGARATLIANAPAMNGVVLVSPSNRHLIAFGTIDPLTGLYDPMLIRWASAEDYTDWTPSGSDTAGDKRLDNGNEILTALISRNEIVIITDRSLYGMALSGDEFVFSFKDEGDAVGAAGPHCAADVNGAVYYMGRGTFQKYTGELAPLECDLQKWVFDSINWLQSAKFYCSRNKTRHEIIWFFCSAASDEIDRWVSLNYVDGTWARGYTNTMLRSAYIDENSLIEQPLATGLDGYLYAHEIGRDADGAALPCSLESYDTEIGSSDVAGPGEVIQKIRAVIPDFQELEGQHTLTLTGRNYPRGETFEESETFDEDTDIVGIHMRSRQVSIKIESNAVGAHFRLGGLRADVVGLGGR